MVRHGLLVLFRTPGRRRENLLITGFAGYTIELPVKCDNSLELLVSRPLTEVRVPAPSVQYSYESPIAVIDAKSGLLMKRI